MRTVISVVAAAACGSIALAQPCEPSWDYAVGTPGASSGYVGALTIYQGDLVVSGSFPSMAGAASTQFLARLDRDSGVWSSFGPGLGSGISNAFGTSFAEMGGDLFVGGFFADAAGVPDTKSIARWDGSAFHSLGTGWAFDSVNAVWSLLATDAIDGQDRLYIGGGFDNIAGQPAGCIAQWDGTTLTPLAPTMTLVGINPLVTAMTVFDDGQGGGEQLYIGGRFSAVGGVAANMIARWNGSVWTPVGTNLTPRLATGEIDGMVVWDDGSGPALYVGGINFQVNGVSYSVAKWNGLTWTPVGQNLAGRTWTLAVFDDGSGEALYGGGTQASVGRIYRLEGNTWVMLDGGADAQVVKLLVDGSRMYAAGSFTQVDGLATGRMVERVGCGPVCGCPADYNGDGGVDGSDVEAFYNDWESSIGCSDVNQDGGVDGSDVEAFFGAWEAGGC